MSEQKAIFKINIIKQCIDVYFDTFFVFYFFKVSNYEISILAKYYLTLYLFTGIGFWLIRNAMKQNIKVPYLQIGISLQAIYIALIMLLKNKLVNYVFLIGIVRGIADGFYWFPKNILESEKINNEDRQKFNGFTNTIQQIVAILIPVLLGFLLTYIDYINLGKIFFLLFILMFIISFKIKDSLSNNKKFEIKKFRKLAATNKSLKKSLLIPFLSGLTYSSGVMGLIITLCKINNFKTNLNLGIVDSICAILALLVCILFTKIKRTKFKSLLLLSGLISFISLGFFSIYSSFITLAFYLLVRFSFIKIISLISENTIVNLTNSEEIKLEFKSEYYCIRDLIFSISRCLGYLVLLIVCLVFGIEYINYIMIISAISLLIEAIFLSKLNS